MANVQIPAPLRPLAGGASTARAAGATLRDVIADLERQFPALAGRIIDAGGIRPEVFLSVAGQEATDLSAPVAGDAEVFIVPAIAGGASEPIGPACVDAIGRERRSPPAPLRW